MKNILHGTTNDEGALHALHGGLSENPELVRAFQYMAKNSDLSRTFWRTDLNMTTPISELNFSIKEQGPSIEEQGSRFGYIEGSSKLLMCTLGTRLDTDRERTYQLQLGSGFFEIGVSYQETGKVEPYININTRLGLVSIKLKSLLLYIFFSLFKSKRGSGGRD